MNGRLGESQRLVSRPEAADFLGLKCQTLAVWTHQEKHLPTIKVGRAVRYRVADLERFLEERTTQPAH